jgi:hypothetical protein
LINAYNWHQADAKDCFTAGQDPLRNFLVTVPDTLTKRGSR